MPANSKTVFRSRQLPAIAPGIAACACLIRLYSFGFWCSEVLGFFRSCGAGFVSAFVPRLAPWAALFRRFAAGSGAGPAASLFFLAFCFGLGSELETRFFFAPSAGGRR